jgi:ribosomal protein L25 (general stress protein Ctc)
MKTAFDRRRESMGKSAFRESRGCAVPGIIYQVGKNGQRCEIPSAALFRISPKNGIPGKAA